MTTYDFNLITAFANSAPSNEIEPFPDYDRGLGIAFVETDGKPEMKGLNGLFSLMTVSLLALKQRGILNWTTGFEYKQGAFAVESNKLYQAKIDNTSKQPSLSQNEWQVWASVSDIDVDTNGNIIKTAKAGGAFTLKVDDASATVKGVVQFANSTEVSNRSNVAKAINPSNVGQTFGGSFSENGWCRLPNGLIFQWGTVYLSNWGGTENDRTYGFNTQFTEQCLNVSCTRMKATYNSTDSDGGVLLSSKTTSNFTVSLQNFGGGVDGLRGFTWFAIGY